MIGHVKHGAQLNHVLSSIVKHIEVETGGDVILTSSARTIQEHVKIYKQLDKDGKLDRPWYEEIPWGSYHLPKWENSFCNAMDIAVRVNSRKISGKRIAELARPVLKEYGAFNGVGIGSNFCHIDIRPRVSADWAYNY